MEEVDCLVIGAGVVGLSVARAMARAGREVLVLEAETLVGSQMSSRNSEVIHAGIYYPQGSLKARLCVEGRRALYAYCAERGVAHSKCGKLIVASTPDQLPLLDDLLAKARANGVEGMRRLTRSETLAMEPALRTEGALLSPETGIVDSHGLMLAYQGEAEDHGATVALASPVAGGEAGPDGVTIEASGIALRARTVVNCAALNAIPLAASLRGYPVATLPKLTLARGNYFSLTGPTPFKTLIYPAPAERGGLGVHLTLDLQGRARFGPDVEWIEAVDYAVNAARGERFYEAIRRYWPELPDGALAPAYAGIRPKIGEDPGGFADFTLHGPETHGVPGLWNLFGMESPGLTSSLAIGEWLRDRAHAA
ncbi:NAD(P)/FAD-dependent oxidoreductase [uncultured Albimonas sp.]|uniref:NAD(P)/FAD-dependent oxidoreductase n=1 Tax=uncultured Albimonas sp. TaxID=1331701 RepID=UPI0030EEE569|tara:strand:- start:322 stop:1422 length:1101 start_codon:yes stop_codon:yes gene_type:complete